MKMTVAFLLLIIFLVNTRGSSSTVVKSAAALEEFCDAWNQGETPNAILLGSSCYYFFNPSEITHAQCTEEVVKTTNGFHAEVLSSDIMLALKPLFARFYANNKTILVWTSLYGKQEDPGIYTDRTGDNFLPLHNSTLIDEPSLGVLRDNTAFEKGYSRGAIEYKSISLLAIWSNQKGICLLEKRLPNQLFLEKRVGQKLALQLAYTCIWSFGEMPKKKDTFTTDFECCYECMTTLGCFSFNYDLEQFTCQMFPLKFTSLAVPTFEENGCFTWENKTSSIYYERYY